MQKDFITATPDSGGSGSTTVTAAASVNQTESARSVNLSVGWRRNDTYCRKLQQPQSQYLRQLFSQI